MSRLHLKTRILLVALHDVVMAAVSLPLALWLRYWLADLPWQAPNTIEATLMFAGISAIVFRYAGLYRGIWHFASLPDMLAIFRGVTLTPLGFTLVLFFVTRLGEIGQRAGRERS